MLATPTHTCTYDTHRQWLSHAGLLLDLICVVKTWHSEPEPNQIQSGVAQYDLGRQWKNATKSESGKLVVGRMHSVRSWPNDSCTAACFWTRSVWPKPEQAIQVRSGPVLHNMIWAYFRRVKPNYMRNIWHIYMQPSLSLAARWL